jgi:group I intron endonuclease
MFSRSFKIYLITNNITNEKYVGITKLKLKSRFYFHKTTLNCPRLSNAIKKYGGDNFKIEILFNAFSIKDMINLENYFIKLYNTLSPSGYNLREGGKYGLFSEEVKQNMSIRWKEKWKNERYSEHLKKLDKYRNEYINSKKEPIVGVNIKNSSIIRYKTIQSSINDGYNPSSVLNRTCKYDHYYIWFYDEGFSDNFYRDLAEFQLGGFGSYSKGRNSWLKSNKKQRIQKMIEGSKHRAKPIIGVSRFDGSILEFPSISQAGKIYTTGSLCQSLTGTCKHAYNHYWFYKDQTKNHEYYVNLARSKFGEFNDTNIKQFKAVNVSTGEELVFNQLSDVKSKGFLPKAVRQVLIGRRKIYSGYTWSFIL